MSNVVTRLLRAVAPILAIGALLFAMGGTWSTTPRVLAAPTAAGPHATDPRSRRTTGSRTGARPAPGKPGPAGPSGPIAPTRSAPPTTPPAGRHVVGKINLNTATEAQLVVLPSVGPAKADRIVTWRKRNGGFKRTADLRRVKGIGYRTFKRLEPFLAITGDTTLARQ